VTSAGLEADGSDRPDDEESRRTAENVDTTATGADGQ
jgi:hypothetical protein